MFLLARPFTAGNKCNGCHRKRRGKDLFPALPAALLSEISPRSRVRACLPITVYVSIIKPLPLTKTTHTELSITRKLTKYRKLSYTLFCINCCYKACEISVNLSFMQSIKLSFFFKKNTNSIPKRRDTILKETFILNSEYPSSVLEIRI